MTWCPAPRASWASDILTESLADGVRFDFICGDEVCGACTRLREFLEARRQSYVLRVACSFQLTLARELTLTCANAASRLLKDPVPRPPGHAEHWSNCGAATRPAPAGTTSAHTWPAKPTLVS